MQALLDRLENIDVDARIAELSAYIQANKHKGPAKIDKHVKALKVLRELKNNGATPIEAFTRDTVPVIPAQYRAPIQLPNNTFVVPDVNDLLRNIGMMSESLKEIRDDLPPDELEKARRDLYNNVAMLQGLEVPEINRQIKKNYYATLSGSPGPAKSGYYQKSLTKKRVNLSGRGVISPNPQLDMDQVEIPIDMGMTMYKPFVKRELLSRGYSPDKVNKLINSRDPLAVDALQRAGNVRPVILNRAPSITEGSMTAHWPTFVDKYNVNIPNVLAQYQLGDFDGDTMGIHVPISQKAIRDAEKMMPSLHMYNEVADKIRGFPDHSAAIGLYILSKAPEGRKAINDILPERHRISDRLTKPQLTGILTDIAKEDSRAAAVVVDNLLRLGDNSAYEAGFSFGLSDLEPLTALRKDIMGQIDREIKGSKDKSPDKLREIYKKYSNIASGAIEDYFKESDDNPVGDIIVSKARGSSSQMRDLLFSPISVNAAEQLTKPIKHSYMEGLTPSEYFAGAAGARAGTIGKSQGTAQPGALGKILFANTNMLVINKDKGASMGSVRLSVDENPGDLLDRYLSEDVYAGRKLLFEKETVVTPRIIQVARKNNIKELAVYSPLGSSSADGGVPAMSYGIIKGNKLPEVGYNIGAHASAGIVSPLYTESMQSFHCFHGDVSVYTKEGHLKTLETLYRENYRGEVLDIWGNYIKVTEMWAHEVTDTMAMSKTKSGESIIAQRNHPMQIMHKYYPCGKCGCKDVMVKNRKIRCADCGGKLELIKGLVLEDRAITAQIEDRHIAGCFYHVESFRAKFGSIAWDWDIDPYMFGAHIAEGAYTNRNNSNHNEGLIWCQYPGTSIYDKYRELLGETTNGKSFQIINDSLNKRMLQETGRVSHERRLPFNILNYPRDVVIEILAGIIDGDGTIMRFPRSGRHSGYDVVHIDSTSYALVSQLHILCNNLGHKSNVFPCKYRENSRWQPYRIAIKFTPEDKEELLPYCVKIASAEHLGERNGDLYNGTIGYIADIKYDHPMVYDVKTNSGTFIANEIWTHNTGGSLQDNDAGYPRLKQVLELTKSMGNKASLASVAGTVSSIKKDTLGGHNITIEGVDHYVSPNNKVNVGVGSSVEKGNPISDGPLDPRDIARLKDLSSAQKYMVDELVKNTPGHLKRRAAEVIVEGLTRYGEVVDPGDAEYLPGDIKLISEIEKRNRDLGEKVKYEPVFRGVNTLPTYSQQWMSQLNFRNIKKTLANAIATGAKSDIHSYEPAPALAWGTEFGEGKDGKY